MFYAGYLSEEIVGSGFSIAPGCVGTRVPGNRCTFNEFMEHIWAPFPGKGDLTRPKVQLINPRTDFVTCKLALLLQQMNGYKRAKMAKPITGNIDTVRLFPGSSDYYDAMRKCGSVMQQMRTFVDTMPDDERKVVAEQLVGRAKEAANYVVDIRANEMDNNEINPRLKDLEKRTGFPLATKVGRDSTGRIGAYQVWDLAKSIENRPGDYAQIMQAYRAWKLDPANDNRFV